MLGILCGSTATAAAPAVAGVSEPDIRDLVVLGRTPVGTALAHPAGMWHAAHLLDRALGIGRPGAEHPQECVLCRWTALTPLDIAIGPDNNSGLTTSASPTTLYTETDSVLPSYRLVSRIRKLLAGTIPCWKHTLFSDNSKSNDVQNHFPILN
ncbi:hypothetical protein CYMTET_17290 [Cymbomonas tetramitiformis]|uniref:Uncharacterized protein n=1 Tax=Cymbomonas tetramitiformis TaxID=36881 RepID=A0AAE0GAM2_9CHLO|nr:hypothetical protein CYMTET_17290 [Cymbomonas tetramitiformis]